jgi:hypothetical protein
VTSGTVGIEDLFTISCVCREDRLGYNKSSSTCCGSSLRNLNGKEKRYNASCLNEYKFPNFFLLSFVYCLYYSLTLLNTDLSMPKAEALATSVTMMAIFMVISVYIF